MPFTVLTVLPRIQVSVFSAGILVGVGEAEGVGVGVGEAEGVGVGEAAGVGVAVGVGVGVGHALLRVIV